MPEYHNERVEARRRAQRASQRGVRQRDRGARDRGSLRSANRPVRDGAVPGRDLAAIHLPGGEAYGDRAGGCLDDLRAPGGGNASATLRPRRPSGPVRRRDADSAKLSAARPTVEHPTSGGAATGYTRPGPSPSDSPDVDLAAGPRRCIGFGSLAIASWSASGDRDHVAHRGSFSSGGRVCRDRRRVDPGLNVGRRTP
jgi:hypothetical protein